MYVSTFLLTTTLIIITAAAPYASGQLSSVKPKIRGSLLEEWDRQLQSATASMLKTSDDYRATVLWTVGQTSESGYTPPGIFDGMGAYKLSNVNNTLRLLVNHELRNTQGYEYVLDNGLTARGARVSYFDIDINRKRVKDAALAYDLLYDVDGAPASDRAEVFLNDFKGLSRFCSGRLVKPEQFESGSGVKELIYFAPEEDGGEFNEHGGHYWALDVEGEIRGLWDIGALGRGAWENLAPVSA